MPSAPLIFMTNIPPKKYTRNPMKRRKNNQPRKFIFTLTVLLSSNMSEELPSHCFLLSKSAKMKFPKYQLYVYKVSVINFAAQQHTKILHRHRQAPTRPGMSFYLISTNKDWQHKDIQLCPKNDNFLKV